MSTATNEVLDELAAGRLDQGYELDHLVCTFTDPDLAFCGKRIPGEPDIDGIDPDDPNTCVVCLDLSGDRRCTKCRRLWRWH